MVAAPDELRRSKVLVAIFYFHLLSLVQRRAGQIVDKHKNVAGISKSYVLHKETR
jgi:hypothetical protein